MHASLLPPRRTDAAAGEQLGRSRFLQFAMSLRPPNGNWSKHPKGPRRLIATSEVLSHVFNVDQLRVLFVLDLNLPSDLPSGTAIWPPGSTGHRFRLCPLGADDRFISGSRLGAGRRR